MPDPLAAGEISGRHATDIPVLLGGSEQTGLMAELADVRPAEPGEGAVPPGLGLMRDRIGVWRALLDRR